MSDSKSSTSGGMGICGVLTVVFVVLKVLAVAPVAAWSWWWVLSPLWIGALVGIGVFLLFGLVALIISIFSR